MSYKRFSLRSGHRNLMLKNITTSLFKYGKIKTTECKAKEVKRIADKIITLGKRGKNDLHSIRQVLSYLTDEDVVMKKVFDEYAKKYADRKGGYTRIIKSGYRKGDSAKMAILELIDL